MTKDKALKLALEALDCIESPLHVREINKVGAAMAAIKEALAQPEQEPVFWYKPYPNGMYNGPIHNAQIGDVLRGSEEWIPLYTTPPQRKPLTDEQIWDAYMKAPVYIDCDVSDLHKFARAIEAKLRELNKAPAKQQRKPLTEQEIVDLCDGTLTTWEQVRIARAIEAAHGIKGDA